MRSTLCGTTAVYGMGDDRVFRFHNGASSWGRWSAGDEAASGRRVRVHDQADVDVLQVCPHRAVSSSHHTDALSLLGSGTEWTKAYAWLALISTVSFINLLYISK